MMEKKRERNEIILDMLLSIRDKGGRIKPTHLMYKSNLAHKQLKTYLEDLLDKGLVTKVHKDRNEYIIISDKGLQFAEKMSEMREFEKAFGFR